jgi:hypothetical protein
MVTPLVRRRFASAIVVLVTLTATIPPARADDDASRAEIAAALTQWTADFNSGRADKVCDLFARDLRAEFRGQPERGYDVQCGLLQRSLADRARLFVCARGEGNSGGGRHRGGAADVDADRPAEG